MQYILVRVVVVFYGKLGSFRDEMIIDSSLRIIFLEVAMLYVSERYS